MKQPIYTYELKIYDGRCWPLTDQQYRDIRSKISRGAKVIEMPDSSLVAQGNIASVQKKQVTMADFDDSVPALPAGERAFDPNGPGYQKFLAAWKKVNPKGYSTYIRKLAERAEQTNHEADTDNHQL